MAKKIIQLKSFHTPNTLEAGCDEAGRGCLAGPVVAAAVILPANFQHDQLTDSKKLSDVQRRKLRPVVEENALAWAVGIVSNEEIDEINILNASFLAMHRALDQLKQIPERILVDGNRFKPYKNIPHDCIIKGDGKYLSIAAASILAKTYRDDIMIELHEKYPVYDWHKNMGYPTQKHRDMIQIHGTTPHHRMSFNLIDRQQKIEFPE
ncbi:MAG: ribonuclease HII [Salinivirgaceae bacterium]|nr:MAG: ribonuclease HII [Salinivirgaceae bacterium]